MSHVIVITLNRRDQTAVVDRRGQRQYAYQSFTRRWSAFLQFAHRFTWQPLIVATDSSIYIDCGSIYTCDADAAPAANQPHAARIRWIVLTSEQVAALVNALRGSTLDPETLLILDGILPDDPDALLSAESNEAIRQFLFRCAECETWRELSERSATFHLCTICAAHARPADAA